MVKILDPVARWVSCYLEKSQGEPLNIDHMMIFLKIFYEPPKVTAGVVEHIYEKYKFPCVCTWWLINDNY